MPSSLFGPSQKKQAKEFHYDIVKNLIDLAREISIVEKFQDSQPSQFNQMRKNDIEMQASRFDKLQWEVYNKPFIVINE